MRKLLRLLTALVLACVALSVLITHQAAAEEKRVQRVDPTDPLLLKQIRRYQRVTWRWQRLMGVRRTPTTHAARTDPSHRYRLWMRNRWHRRAFRARRLALRPPHRSAWRCIHRYEGAWNDPSPPYYGGLQMDISFQRAYGRDLLQRKGTANRWTPLEQMWVAERAHRRGRGFYPWPNTARACGLI